MLLCLSHLWRGIVQYKNPGDFIHGNEKLSCVDPSAGFYGSPAGGFLKR
jgi:hypothetical protein